MYEYKQFKKHAKRFFEWADMDILDKTKAIPDNSDAITTDSLKTITDQINAISLWSFILKPWKLIPLFILRRLANRYAAQVNEKLPKQPALNSLENNDNPHPNNVGYDESSYRQVSAASPAAEPVNPSPAPNGRNAEHQTDENQFDENNVSPLLYLPTEIWTKNILTELTVRDLANLVLAGDKEMNKHVLLPELSKVTTQLLLHLQQGQRNEAIALIKDCPVVLLTEGKLNNELITPLQWAIKHFDSDMLKVILEHWPKGHEHTKIKQLKVFTTTDLLNCMQQNQFDAAEELIKANPQLLLQKGVNCITGELMTPLQWTYWQHDTHARRMLEKYWPPGKDEAMKAQALDFRANMEPLDHSILTGENSVYDQYINQEDELWDQGNWDEHEKLEYAIARALRPWPHVIAELTRRDRHMAPKGNVPQFNEYKLPRDCKYENRQKIFPLREGKGLGHALKLFRGERRGGAGRASKYSMGSPPINFVRQDRAGIIALFEVRTTETNGHIDSLLNPSPKPQHPESSKDNSNNDSPHPNNAGHGEHSYGKVLRISPEAPPAAVPVNLSPAPNGQNAEHQADEDQPEENNVSPLLYLPTEIWTKNILTELTVADLANLVLAGNKEMNEQVLLPEIGKVTTQLLQHLQQEQSNEATALIKDCPVALLREGEVNNEFITPLQWAIKHFDSDMLKVILDHWPKGHERTKIKQLQEFTTTDLLNCMQQNQFDAAEELIKVNPQLLLQKGINPITGELMTPLQWNYWQHDTHARNMLLKHWPEDEMEAMRKQAKEFRESMESLNHQILIIKYGEYIDQYDKLRQIRARNELRHLQCAIAKALRIWPHVIAELTRSDCTMYPNGGLPEFNEENLPRDCKYVFGTKIFPLRDGKGLGFEYKLFRGKYAAQEHGPAGGWDDSRARIDRAGIAKLFEIRITETNVHIDSLINTPKLQP